jgi:ribonuclease G
LNDKSAEGLDFCKIQNEPEIIKTGRSTKLLGGKPNILVQILKDRLRPKGPRLSCEISLPGRFVVITPFNNIVAVSRKSIPPKKEKGGRKC